MFIDNDSKWDHSVDLNTKKDKEDNDEQDWYEDEIEEEDITASRWPQIKVTRDEQMRWSKPWRRALVLRLLGRNISHKILEQRLCDLWKLENGFHLIDMDGVYFIARFYAKDDYFKVLEEGPWIILGHYLTVSKSRPNLRPSIKEVSTIMVWVRLPELPIEFFNEELLLRVGNHIDRLVCVDSPTKSQLRGGFARLCVYIYL